MPEIAKITKPNGDLDLSKIFMGFAVACVLILQQWQSFRIAEIKVQGEVNKINFMSKENVEERFRKLEDHFIPSDNLKLQLDHIKQRLDELENK